MNPPHAYQWARCPEAAQFVGGRVQNLLSGNGFAERLAQRFLPETGTRFVDWIDCVGIQPHFADQLAGCGFQEDDDGWCHPGAVLPRVVLRDSNLLAIKVDSIDDFMAVHHESVDCHVRGEPGSQFRSALFQDATDFLALQRHGHRGLGERAPALEQITAARTFYVAISNRLRSGREEPAFQEADSAVRRAVKMIGTDWACDIFFWTEREYWQSRNLAARIQKQRQDRLGVGWANHDHHTYRCSREHFAKLISILELLGFRCRERFYAGEQAGWGAQVLEQPACGIVVFADVDLSPDEVSGDFAHDGLAADSQCKTVGLWCRLHGESFLQAGMHHLECQFDFDAAREQLAKAGIESMAPFTDLPFLRQAFTLGENWKIDPQRIEQLRAKGSISPSQAAQFAAHGAIGSHLEILERKDGFKGFNQAGISHIIKQTDPRTASQST